MNLFRVMTFGGLAVLASGVLFAQPTWRVRADHGAALNADVGWAAPSGQAATVMADQPFRVRFEWERGPSTAGETGVILQYRRNDEEDWIEVRAHDFPYPEAEEPLSPRVSAVSTPGFAHGEPTSDVLAGSATAFVGGTGVNLAGEAGAWTTAPGHVELEWALVVRRWADGAETNEEGDRFELRLADGQGKAVPGAAVATVRLTIPSGHLGGTFVETPGRIGPWRTSNGDLYFIMEPAESDNLFMVVKSSDGGRTWAEVDGANRPATGDLESVEGRLIGDTLHVVHQVTEAVFYHEFRTSDHPTAPDTWVTTDEVAATVEALSQMATLVVRSDGSMVTVYLGPNLHWSTRAVNGTWQEHGPLDPAETLVLAGPQAVLGAEDTVHLAYYREDGTIWYRQMGRDGTLTAAVRLAAGAGVGEDFFGPVLPLVYLPESDTVVVVYRLADGFLWERRIGEGGAPTAAVRVSDRPVVQHSVDSQQAGADVVADGEALHVLFIDEASRDLYHTTTAAGAWAPSTLVVGGLDAAWVRGAVHLEADGRRVYRYVYDAGSRGGAGMNRFGEKELTAARD